MGKLADSAPYYKKFLNGEKGHSHAAQEFGVWASSVGLSAWLISPLAPIIIIIVLMLTADKYWFKREQRQARNMGRGDRWEDFIPDAIDDVEFPRKMRKLWLVLSIIFVLFLLFKQGYLNV